MGWRAYCNSGLSPSSGIAPGVCSSSIQILGRCVGWRGLGVCLRRQARQRALARSYVSCQAATDDLAGFEVEHNRKVVLFAAKPQVREVLYPCAGIRHVSVSLSGLRPCFITKYRELLQSIGRRSYLCWRRTTAPLLAKRRYDDAS